MTILIAYATTEGQTRKICRYCADHLTEAGKSVELLNVADAEGIVIGRFTGVILAGSVHGGQMQKELAKFATDHARTLAAKPVLYLQVSLAAAGDDPDEHADLERIARAFFEEAGWSPDRIEHVAGAFRFSEYDFFKSLAMRWIASKRDEDATDPHKDREYTDWPKLSKALNAWRVTF